MKINLFSSVFVLFCLCLEHLADLFLHRCVTLPSVSSSGQSKSKVYFDFLDLSVTHWQQLVVRKIAISETTTFQQFKCSIRASFSEEITTKLFRVYRLPHKFDSIEQKIFVNTEEEFKASIDLYKNPDEFPPELYIWNHEDASLPKETAYCQSC